MPPRKKRDPQPPPEPETVAPADDEWVEVDFGDNPAETATLLLAAAEELHGDQNIVGTGTGYFRAPKSVVDKAGLTPKE